MKDYIQKPKQPTRTIEKGISPTKEFVDNRHTRELLTDIISPVQRKLHIGDTEYTRVQDVIPLFADDYKIGWDETWSPFLDEIIQYPESISFSNIKLLEIELIRKKSRSTGTVTTDFIDSIRREVTFSLNDLSSLLVEKADKDPEKVAEIIASTSKRYMREPLADGVFKEKIDELILELPKIKIHKKERINGGRATAETRARNPILSPADIDLGEKGTGSIRFLPDDDTKMLSYRRLYGRRIFTLLHELTHSVLGTLDHTESMGGTVLGPLDQQQLGVKKALASNMQKNADSWVMTILVVLEKLRALP